MRGISCVYEQPNVRKWIEPAYTYQFVDILILQWRCTNDDQDVGPFFDAEFLQTKWNDVTGWLPQQKKRTIASVTKLLPSHTDVHDMRG